MRKSSRVLLIYTGGTIGMIQDAQTGALKPFDFNALSSQVPELSRIDVKLDAISFEKPIDSSNMRPKIWIELAEIVAKKYNDYDGFVILHGSDTMSFTASALSFMFEHLAKPVILTGSQLPIGVIRTDGKENLITAIEIAAAKDKKGQPLVPEVAIYFEYELYRGNRTFKYNSAHFDAFVSPNYHILAEAGVNIEYHHQYIRPVQKGKLKVYRNLNNDVAILYLFPGISKKITEATLNIKGLKAIILVTFGSGNAPTDSWFLEAIEKAIEQGIVILNITQCPEGSVMQGKYETSRQLQKMGVVSGADMTMEAAITKLMVLLGQNKKGNALKKLLQQNLRGELSEI